MAATPLLFDTPYFFGHRISPPFLLEEVFPNKKPPYFHGGFFWTPSSDGHPPQTTGILLHHVRAVEPPPKPKIVWFIQCGPPRP